MKIKKHFILIFFLFFCSFISNVHASYGELRYEITEMNIDDKGVRFKGYAFIHQTNNYVTVYKRDEKGNENKNITVATDGGQKVKICAYDDKDKNNQKCVEYECKNDTEYNFYYQMFYQNGTYRLETYNNSDQNKCEGDHGHCYYEDMSFEIYIELAEWLEKDAEVKFTISAFNNNYGKYTEEKEIYVTDGAIDKKDISNGKIKVKPDTTFTAVKFIAKNALWQKVSKSGSAGFYGKTGETYKIYNLNEGNYKNGYESEAMNSCFKGTCFLQNTKGPGRYTFCVNKNTGSDGCSGESNESDFCNECKKGPNEIYSAFGSWVMPDGQTSLIIEVESDKKCEVSEPTDDKEMKCNNWTNLSSTCNELTVRNGNSSATVKIVQNGYISNIFKSNLVNNDKDYDASSYDGGWFKYGIIYYNEVSWELRNLSQGNENEIEEAMQYRLKEKLSDFEVNLNLTINGLDGSRLIKKCTESGEFKNGKKLVTVCTFFLPDIDAISSTGKVSYKESDDNDNINNKYYIPFNEKEHKHSVSVILTGLSRLSENQATKDSKEQNKEWFGTWKIDTGCNLKVVNRLYNPPGGGDGKLKYKFIYRPIDLSNPFPNRFPGVNWYSWYIIEKNKDKKTLEDSYKKLEYYTQLDNKTISEIKKYNKENTYFGEVDEDFFKTYIKEGGNS